MNRVDVLGDDSERLRAFGGRLLDSDLDAELQSIVAEANQALRVPMALVSLVLRRIQFFRAHCGLPPALSTARATDRDASFCQFVVRDGRPFEVTDAATDTRVPKELVDRYGISSYLGIPVCANGHVVGSICAMDLEVRRFTDEDRRIMGALAARASARLQQLALQWQPTSKLVSIATAPAFAELRNLLTPFSTNLCAAVVAAAELKPMVWAAAYDQAKPNETPPLAQATLALEDLSTALQLLQDTSSRVEHEVLALEKTVLAAQQPASLAEVIGAALELSRHATKLVGGANACPVAPDLRLGVNRAAAISIIAASLSHCATEMMNLRRCSPITIETHAGNGLVHVLLHVNLPQGELTSLSTTIAEMVGVEAIMDIRVIPDGLELRFPAAD